MPWVFLVPPLYPGWHLEKPPLVTTKRHRQKKHLKKSYLPLAKLGQGKQQPAENFFFFFLNSVCPTPAKEKLHLQCQWGWHGELELWFHLVAVRQDKWPWAFPTRVMPVGLNGQFNFQPHEASKRKTDVVEGGVSKQSSFPTGVVSAGPKEEELNFNLQPAAIRQLKYALCFHLP